MPAVAPLNLFMSAAAACLRPFRSSVPVITKVMMNTHMLRLETKLEPMVSRNETGAMPATRAVTTAATMITRMESSLQAKPTTTMTMPSSLRSSMGSIGPPLVENYRPIDPTQNVVPSAAARHK